MEVTYRFQSVQQELASQRHTLDNLISDLAASIEAVQDRVSQLVKDKRLDEDLAHHILVGQTSSSCQQNAMFEVSSSTNEKCRPTTTQSFITDKNKEDGFKKRRSTMQIEIESPASTSRPIITGRNPFESPSQQSMAGRTNSFTAGNTVAKTEDQLILKLRDDLIKAREIITTESEIKKKLIDVIRQLKQNQNNQQSLIKVVPLEEQKSTDTRNFEYSNEKAYKTSTTNEVGTQASEPINFLKQSTSMMTTLTMSALEDKEDAFHVEMSLLKKNYDAEKSQLQARFAEVVKQQQMSFKTISELRLNLKKKNDTISNLEQQLAFNGYERSSAVTISMHNAGEDDSESVVRGDMFDMEIGANVEYLDTPKQSKRPSNHHQLIHQGSKQNNLVLPGMVNGKQPVQNLPNSTRNQLIQNEQISSPPKRQSHLMKTIAVTPQQNFNHKQNYLLSNNPAHQTISTENTPELSLYKSAMTGQGASPTAMLQPQASNQSFQNTSNFGNGQNASSGNLNSNHSGGHHNGNGAVGQQLATKNQHSRASIQNQTQAQRMVASSAQSAKQQFLTMKQAKQLNQRSTQDANPSSFKKAQNYLNQPQNQTQSLQQAHQNLPQDFFQQTNTTNHSRNQTLPASSLTVPMNAMNSSNNNNIIAPDQNKQAFLTSSKQPKLQNNSKSDPLAPPSNQKVYQSQKRTSSVGQVVKQNTTTSGNQNNSKPSDFYDDLKPKTVNQQNIQRKRGSMTTLTSPLKQPNNAMSNGNQTTNSKQYQMLLMSANTNNTNKESENYLSDRSVSLNKRRSVGATIGGSNTVGGFSQFAHSSNLNTTAMRKNPANLANKAPQQLQQPQLNRAKTSMGNSSNNNNPQQQDSSKDATGGGSVSNNAAPRGVSARQSFAAQMNFQRMGPGSNNNVGASMARTGSVGGADSRSKYTSKNGFK